MSNKDLLQQLLSHKTMIYDGAMGTMIQSYKLKESDFRGNRFANHPVDLKGNFDILSLTQPKLITEIHSAYLKAGADIICTNSFNASSISQSDYQTEKYAYDLNVESAKIAKLETDKFTLLDKSKPRFVVGSIGPTNRICATSPDATNSKIRAVDFNAMQASYYEQAKGLLNGGVDILLVETIFNTLNAKAALSAIKQLLDKRNIPDFPIWISGTMTADNERTLSGQTAEEFWKFASTYKPFAVGLNCVHEPSRVKPFIIQLSKLADCSIALYPNTGFPNQAGAYDVTPIQLASTLKEFAEDGLLNIVGGCCGSTPEHILAIKDAIQKSKPRKI